MVRILISALSTERTQANYLDSQVTKPGDTTGSINFGFTTIYSKVTNTCFGSLGRDILPRMSASRPLTSFGGKDLLQDLFGRNGTSATAQSLNAKNTEAQTRHTHPVPSSPYPSVPSRIAFSQHHISLVLQPHHWAISRPQKPPPLSLHARNASKKSTQQSNYSCRNGNSILQLPLSSNTLKSAVLRKRTTFQPCTNQRCWHFVSQQVIQRRDSHPIGHKFGCGDAWRA
jgi:hypothetical protein